MRKKKQPEWGLNVYAGRGNTWEKISLKSETLYAVGIISTPQGWARFDTWQNGSKKNALIRFISEGAEWRINLPVYLHSQRSAAIVVRREVKRLLGQLEWNRGKA